MSQYLPCLFLVSQSRAKIVEFSEIHPHPIHFPLPPTLPAEVFFPYCLGFPSTSIVMTDPLLSNILQLCMKAKKIRKVRVQTPFWHRRKAIKLTKEEREAWQLLHNKN